MEATMHEVIKSNRLILRPLETTDADDFARLANHWDICRMTGTFPYPFPKLSVEGLIDIFIARAATGRAFHWAILDNHQFIGVLGLFRTKAGWDVGYWLGEPFWGQGYAGEALKALLDHLCQTDPEIEISACVFTDNPASAKVLTRAGFKKNAGVCKGYSLARGGEMDNWTFQFLGTAQNKMTSQKNIINDACSA